MEYLFEDVEHDFWLNDFVEGDIELDEALVDVSQTMGTRMPLFIGFANPSEGARRRMWELYVKSDDKLFRRMQRGFRTIKVDTVITEVEAGYGYSTVNLIPLSDEVLIISEPDRLAEKQTAEILESLVFPLSRGKINIIINKVIGKHPYSPKFLPSELISQIIPLNPFLTSEDWVKKTNKISHKLDFNLPITISD